MPSSPTRAATSRRLRRSLGVVLTTSALLAPLTLLGPAQAADTVHRDSADEATLALDVLGTFRTNVFDASAAEIVAFHAATQRTFVVNAESGEIDVLNAADPTGPTLVGAIVASDAASIGEGAVANSVAIRPDGLVVAAIEAPTKTDAGWLLFADAASLEILGTVQVGALPDMVAVTPDGTRAVVANEGEPADDFSLDPEGSVGVVDLPATVAAPTQEGVRTATFHAFEAGGTRTLDPAVRIFGPTPEEGNPVSRNLEPEYVAIAPDGTTAYAVLQEANAVAVVDLATATVTDIWPLGAKDHTVPGQGLDPSDRDSASKGPEIKIGEWPVKGLYMPDGINAYQASGSTYLVTANEGDAREWGDYEEPARVKDLGKGGVPPICEDSPLAELRGDAALGRLNVSTASGLNEAGTCFDELYSFGSRSFSIWTTDGTQVFDSGDDFEQTVARVVPNYFNSNHSESNFEGRSDDKGPEPENLTIGTVGGRTYAFIGLERVGGVMVYDISDPANAEYVTYVNNRDFAVSVEDGIEEAADPAAFLASAGDLGPEGLTFVSATDSPTGEALVIVGNEVSGTTTFFGVTDLVEPEPAPLTVTLTSPTVQAGGTLSGEVAGATAGEQLALTLFSDPVALGSVTASPAGTAPFSVQVPATVPPGLHTLQVAGPSGTATTSVTVTAAAVGDSTPGPGNASGTGTTGTLPSTGSEVNAWLILAAMVAVVAGATAVTVAGRRSPEA
ncbi:MAG: choice-of-anchor I family protein [Aeromicrobium sp.]|uniref:choice-of-anchor I family protein n=1 Tax=Aeromicrobium sp. TaxID=1871063 RepID=UPI00262AC0C8|nr:choice-of-anchor I family protein [Aeromicrobium sp.]MDF1705412.1 choice-of-anchor I family protein [Aeromicrobium sp.]